VIVSPSTTAPGGNLAVFGGWTPPFRFHPSELPVSTAHEYGLSAAQRLKNAIHEANAPQVSACTTGRIYAREIWPFWLTIAEGEAYITVPARRPLFGAIARL
jgi:hypothetical protein